MGSSGDEEETLAGDDEQQQLNFTIDVDEEHPPFPSLLHDHDHHQQEQQQPSSNNMKAYAVLKAGLFITVISIGGILYPPLPAGPAAADNAHQYLNNLSKMFHFLVWVNLAIGVSLVLLPILVMNRIPTSITIAKPLTEIGWALTSLTLGYGSSLILMVSSSPWIYLTTPVLYCPLPISSRSS